MIIVNKDPETNEIKCPCGKKATDLVKTGNDYIALCSECISKENNNSEKEIIK